MMGIMLLISSSQAKTSIEKVEQNLTVQIKIHYPDAVNMYLRGDPNVVQNNLSWSKGIFVPEVPSEMYTFSLFLNYSSNQAGKNLALKPMIDDETWCIGANDVIVLPSSFQVIDLYPWFYNDEGSVERIFNVYAPQLNNSRNLWVYLPPSFHENVLKPYQNVLVMHDGQNLFDPKTAFGGNAWMCQDTVNENIVSGNMEEVIIIGVDNTDNRINELTYSYDPSEGAGGQGDLYLDFVEKVVLPLVVNRYSPWRIKLNRNRMGILGSSLGGLLSCYAGWTRSYLYGRMGCMSSSFWWNSQDFNNVILNRSTTPPNQVIYVDSGDSGQDDDDEMQTISVRDHFSRIKPYVININLFYYLDKGGKHSEIYWGRRFWIPMRALYPVQPIEPSQTSNKHK